MKIYGFWFELYHYIVICVVSTTGKSDISKEIASNTLDGRIVGGSMVEYLGTLPWQGLFRTSTGVLCGCSLISTDWALTAAHCTAGFTYDQLTLYFGLLDRTDTSEAQSFAVASIVDHESYDATTLRYDISLLRLGAVATLNTHVGVIQLPAQGGAVADDTNCIISGWGTLSSGGTLPARLQQATVPIVSQTQCQTWFSTFTTQVVYTDVVCAGYAVGGIDTCQGDSGGPLACFDNSTSAYVLHGITSYGFGCADAEKPGVYTRVSEFGDWISQKTSATTTATSSTTTTTTTTTTTDTTTACSTTADSTTTSSSSNNAIHLKHLLISNIIFTFFQL